MSKQNESEKRDFVNQMITLMTEESASMTEKGFDPLVQIQLLSTKQATAALKEIEQQKAAAAAQVATAASVAALKDAYASASNMADLISGLYGKDSEIVKKIRQFRK